MAAIQEGDVVHVHYTGRLEDGTVFDSSEGSDPLEVVAGSDQLIGDLAKTVVGMSVGEKKTITLEPSDAYGERREDLTQSVPVDQLPESTKVGDRLSARTDAGEIPVWVTGMEGDQATIDANHPLAGKKLIFDLEIDRIAETDAG